MAQLLAHFHELKPAFIAEDTKISPFLSSKNIARHLVCKGPSLHVSTVIDISRILRRECPSEECIVDASKCLEHRNDNLWLMDGEEDPQAGQDRWNISSDALAASRKRRKLAPEDTKVTAFLDPTTMDNPRKFSYKGTGDFTSAAAQLRDNTEFGRDPQRRRLSSGDPGLPSSRYDCPGDKAKSKVNSGNLISLWGGKSTLKHVSGSSTDPYARATGFHDANNPISKDHISWRKDSRTPLTTIFSTHKNTEITNPQNSRHLNIIPSGLADHKLRTRPHQNRMRSAESPHDVKPYAFLSSSPPATDDLDPQKTNIERNLGAAPSTTFSTKKNVSEDSALGGKDRPASTYHNTSLAQARQGANHLKRTLGLRRSMAEWSSGGNQRFSVPNKTRNGT